MGEFADNRLENRDQGHVNTGGQQMGNCWKAPMPGTLKLNCDASVSADGRNVRSWCGPWRQFGPSCDGCW